MVVGLTSFLLNVTIMASMLSNCPGIVTRKQWDAEPPKSTPVPLSLPVPYVIIHHTYEPAFCATSEQCAQDMRSIQRYHQDERNWSDIGYNFAVGGDGLVYEGRGWSTVGAHAPLYNNRSLGIVFIGDYQSEVPTATMLSAGRRLIACGVAKGIVSPDYKLLGHRQVRETACPGDAFYELIQRWPHWTPNPDGRGLKS